jgi:uncharacterized protein (DUF1501 family)
MKSSRRALLGPLLGLGTSFVLGRSRLAFADIAAPAAEARLVVVLLRGALDGLAAVPPYGDADYARHRGDLAMAEPGQAGGALDLGGKFGLHPRLSALHRLYTAGDALVVHAVAGPWRSRSHFEAQDLLEAGAEQRLSSGWLNRALRFLPPEATTASRRAMAMGVDVPLLLRGPNPVGSFSPAGPARMDTAIWTELAALNRHDRLLGPAFAEGLRARGYSAAVLAGTEPPPGDRNAFPALAAAAGRLLAQPNGPRIAALELTGWDTHAFQPGRLLGPLGQLDDGLAALQAGLGLAWRQAAILVVTEFGRTVRVNGTRGTDHGTAAAAFVVGGAVAGGRLLTDWPGLGDGQLFQDRDLAPTRDLRSIAKGLLRDHLKLPAAALEQAFPGGQNAAAEAGLLRS